MSFRILAGIEYPGDYRVVANCQKVFGNIFAMTLKGKRKSNIPMPANVLPNIIVALHPKTLLTEFELKKLVEKYYIRSGGQ